MTLLSWLGRKQNRLHATSHMSKKLTSTVSGCYSFRVLMIKFYTFLNMTFTDTTPVYYYYRQEEKKVLMLLEVT